MNQKMHSHTFVEHYEGMVGFGLDRETDEKSLMVYLQKFSDDALLAALVPRLSPDEIQDLFERISLLLKKHLQEAEYHRLFLKDENA
jgi:TorA maturation chaperone TorD